jgi:hypothetical protein
VRWPLYAAGFTTAFGAHAVAANLGVYTENRGRDLLVLGLLLALGFAHLAATTPPDRLGSTMGAAEVGRELGDAGGPLLVGALATATTLTGGLAALAAVLAAGARTRPAVHPATRRPCCQTLVRVFEPRRSPILG